MIDTKERILQTALHLFAQEGYEAVSVSDIAGALGMTKSALYKHFSCKRDIFDSILARMEQSDARQAEEYALPTQSYAEVPTDYASARLSELIAFSMTMFRCWTEDPFACDFRRMLTLEQFRDREQAALYRQYLSAGPLSYVEELLGAMGCPAPEHWALRIFAPMHLLFAVYDAAEDRQSIASRLAMELSLVEKELADAMQRESEHGISHQ